jgi:hypothetical protein
MRPNLLRAALAVVIGCATASLAFAQAPAPAHQPRRVALLVGINDYQRRGFVDLRWAENDVTEVGRELLGLGFDKVVTMTGASAGDLRPTRANIEAQLKALLAGVGKNDIVLVMLSGHGQQLAVKRQDGTTHDDGFYCPIDAALGNADTMLSLSHLTDDVLQTWGGKNLVLVDACRDIVDTDRGVRARGVQGRVVSLPEGTAVLFSCAAGQQSLERNDLKHGVFTYGVLEALRAPDAAVTWGSLVDRVQNRVAELTPVQEPIAAGAIGRLVLGRRTTQVVETSRGPRLVWKFVPGQTFHYRTDETSVNRTSTNGRAQTTTDTWSMDTSWTVKSVEEGSGTGELARSVTRFRRRVESPQGVSEFDSAGSKPTQGLLAPSVPLFNTLVRTRCSMKISRQGLLSDFRYTSDPVQLYRQLNPTDTGGGPPSAESMKTMIQDAVLFLPDSLDQPWTRVSRLSVAPLGTLVMNGTYRHEGVAEGKDKIGTGFAFDLEPDPVRPIRATLVNPRGQVTYLFDREAGRMTLSQEDLSYQIRLSLNGALVSMETETRTVTKLVGVTSEPTR